MSGTAGRRSAAQLGTPRVATAGDLHRIGTVLGAAFWDDPVWEWVCPDPQRRGRHLGRAFAAVIRPRVHQGLSWTTDDVAGAAVWAAPGDWKARPVDGLRSIPPMYRAIGPRGLRERLEALATIERHHPREPHWYLEFLAADPLLRGRGVGTALLAPMLERIDDEGMPAYLESSKLDNVPFYERFGFRVVEEISLGAGAPPMWLMWRDPR